MNIPAAARLDLRLLEEALDGSPSDTRASLMALSTGAAQAVPSYLGLSVLLPLAGEAPLTVTTFENDRDLQQIGASLRFGVRGESWVGPQGSALIELILYAGRPGAFVDLAADLIWLTGRPWHEFHIDEDLAGPKESDGARSVTSWSTINQARGVLISGGLTVEQADAELDLRAAVTGSDRSLAAAEILAGVSSGEHPPPP